MKSKTISELLSWQTAGYEKYRVKKKAKFSKSNFLTFAKKKFIHKETLVTDIILELYWQLESLQTLLDHTIYTPKKIFPNHSDKE